MTEQQEQRPGASTEPSVDVRSVLIRARSIINEGTERTPSYECADVVDAIDILLGRAGAASTEATPPDAALRVEYYTGRAHGYAEGLRASTEATPPHSLSCEVVETLGSGHERCQCTCHDGEMLAPTEATERMRQNIAALRRDDDRDRYLRERFRQDVAAIRASGATEGPGLCPRCGVTLADTGYYEDGYYEDGYYEDGQRCHDPAEATERPDLERPFDSIPEAQKSTADLALQRSKSRHAAWCFLPADHDGACDGDQ